MASPDKIISAAQRAVSKYQENFMPVIVVSAPADITDDLISLSRQISNNFSGREYDALISCGEQISAALLAGAINNLGIKAISLNGLQAGIKTDSTFSGAKIKHVNKSKIFSVLEKGFIPVITGFQGADSEYNITTLGRGGSDLTAVTMAKVLNAHICEFYTDVKGIYSAHPGLIPEAISIPVISYDEVISLGKLGTEVRQLSAIAFAKKYGLRLSLRSSFTDDEGTVIQKTSADGIHALVLNKSGENAAISAVGYKFTSDDINKFKSISSKHKALSFYKNKHIITVNVPSVNKDLLLKELHSSIIIKKALD